MNLSSKELRRFFAGIVIPAILTIILFIVSIYAFIIPAFEKNIMDKKREMLSELVNTTWSLIEEYDKDYKEGKITLHEAQNLSIQRIEKIRYGQENKDYFWITDMTPVMIMHPYRKELNGTKLDNYKDQEGKLLFVEAVQVVKSQNEGFIDYMWQWKDDSTRIVPKLSFVKAYKNWNWIIGTGIYIEDVNEEIHSLKTRLIKITFFVLVIIGIIVGFIIKQSLDIERKRKDIENELKSSRRKYQTLVEASVDGTLLIIDDRIIFSNAKFNDSFGSSGSYVLSLSINEIFDIDWENIKSLFTDQGKSKTIETTLKTIKKPHKEVVLTISKVTFGKQKGYILIAKDLTKIKLVEKETEHLSNEVQTSLLLMNQPIKHFITDYIKCDMQTSIASAASLMSKKNKKVIFIEHDNKLIGVVNDKDFRDRVVSKNIDTNEDIFKIMSSPLIYIKENVLLYEAVLLFQQENVSHLLVKDNSEKIVGVISNKDILEMQRNSISYMIREIELSESIEQIDKITKKLPILIHALIDSGARIQNITRIITSLTDAITQRIIIFAIEKLGVPPCNFTFMALGSEGRMEQTLATDQDNAIIIENIGSEIKDSVKNYFLSLGKLVSHDLNTVGFKFCNGGVMASNPKWVLTLNEWKEQFKSWIVNSDPKSILEAGIFFDFRNIYGETFYTDELKGYVLELVENKATFFHHLANPILKFKSNINLFGSVVGESSTNFDIKKIILPIISFIRIYSLLNKVSETNSLDRLENLKSINKINDSLYHEIDVSYNYLMLLRFKSQIEQVSKGIEPDNLITVAELSDIEKTTIKKILSEISSMQTQLNFDFKGFV